MSIEDSRCREVFNKFKIGSSLDSLIARFGEPTLLLCGAAASKRSPKILVNGEQQSVSAESIASWNFTAEGIVVECHIVNKVVSVVGVTELPSFDEQGFSVTRLVRRLFVFLSSAIRGKPFHAVDKLDRADVSVHSMQ